MNTHSCDTLIVGQGLAGSLLAWHLHRQGQKVCIISRPDAHSASRMAAGLINPITGKRLVRSPQVPVYLEHARAMYLELESQLSLPLLHDKPMIRLFRDAAEKEYWKKRQTDPDYRPYLEMQTLRDMPAGIRAPLGGFRQLQTGYLDTALLLDGLADYFRQQALSMAMTVDHASISVTEDGVVLDKLQAQRLIFCEGYHAINNPWFDWLPFRPAKGEILTIQLQDLQLQDIINTGHWLIPIGDDLYRFGASFERQRLDEQTSDEVRHELLTALSGLTDGRIATLIRHEAGIRPCTRDTNPFVGMHPTCPRLGIFNGFGSKGSLMIPYYARQFSAWLRGQQADLDGVDIRRYWTNAY